MSERNFFAELKRRNVYKVAVVYAVTAWVLIQAASILLPTFEAPSWVMKVVVMVITLGFPVALILAWALELTPEGLKRTEDVDRATEKRRKSHLWIYVVAAAAVLSIGLFLLGRYTGRNIASAARTEAARGSPSAQKSIAVLPFENLSQDKANAYFAEGIQEEVLTRLARITELKVISRTSTQQYQSKPGNLSEIAKQLGVGHILEGSVQKAGDQVRVNVQLINALTDAHLWAETYDRKLIDIFAVESEIAKSIAESLHAKLSGREEQALAVKPTNNSEAYDAYLRGLAFDARSSYSGDATKTAIDSYARAVQLDPTFALAWARLSRAHANVYFRSGDTTAARRDAAKRALENAQKLQPNSSETLLALGYYQYWVLRDYGLAKTTFGLVRKTLPGNSEVLQALGAVTRREGIWEESVSSWEQALALDPRSPELLSNAAFTYTILRQFPVALKLYDRALDLLPNDVDLMAIKATIYQAQGKLPEAARLLIAINAQTPSETAFGIKVAQLRLERNHAEAIGLLETRLAQFAFGSEIDRGVSQVLLALAQRLAGDTGGAKATAEQARRTLEPLLENQPDNSDLAALLALVHAVRGDKDSAVEMAQRAMVLLPTARDRVNGPALEANLALIQTMSGDISHAISSLTRLLQAPCGSLLDGPELTPAVLRIDPLWDPLRGDPTFQNLCAENQR